MEETNKFFKLAIDEVETKLNKFCSDKGSLRVWRKGNLKNNFKVKNLKFVNGDLVLVLFSEGNDTDVTICFSSVYFNFILMDMEYFGEARVSPGAEEDTLELNFLDYIYRAEKRSHDRLLTFPHHQVYVYYNFISNDDFENVVSLNRTIEKNLKAKKVELKKRVFEKLSTVVDGGVDSLCGYRVLDLSKNGAAFLVDATEASYFEEASVSTCYISFNEEVFNIDDAKVVYNVDYLSSSTNKKNKVGINFNAISNLSNFILKILNTDDQDDIIFSDFENFIKSTD